VLRGGIMGYLRLEQAVFPVNECTLLKIAKLAEGKVEVEAVYMM
jgi:hypothetical protein